MFTTTSEIEAIDVRRRGRHGKIWEHSEYKEMLELFHKGHSLRLICDKLERPAAGVMSKLKTLGEVSHDNTTGVYHYTNAQPKIKPTTLDSTQEKTMSNNQPINTITYLFGNDIKACEVSDLIKAIQKCQSEIATHAALPSNAYSAKRIEELNNAVNVAVNELNTRA